MEGSGDTRQSLQPAQACSVALPDQCGWTGGVSGSADSGIRYRGDTGAKGFPGGGSEGRGGNRAKRASGGQRRGSCEQGAGRGAGKGMGQHGVGQGLCTHRGCGGLGRQQALPGADILLGGGEGRHLGDSVGSEVQKKLSVFLRMNE